MFDLARFFQNPFDDRNISYRHLANYTTDHLARLAANDPDGAFAGRRAATATAWATFVATDTDNEGQLGQRKGRKQTKQAFRKALPAAVKKIWLRVASIYGERAPEVVECFPGGRLVFARCGDALVAEHLATLINGLTAHAAALPSATLASAQALLDDWRGVYQASGSAGGVKAGAEKARRDARRGLERELYLNLLALAQVYPWQPEKLALFTQPSLLLPHRHHPQK